MKLSDPKMNMTKLLEISALVAKRWENKEYVFLTQKEAWDKDLSAYDDGIYFMAFSCGIFKGFITANPGDLGYIKIFIGEDENNCTTHWIIDLNKFDFEIHLL